MKRVIKNFKWLGARTSAVVTAITTGLLLSQTGVASALPITFYNKTNTISDIPGVAQVYDKEFVNPWGLSRSPTGPWWISDNGSGKSSVYAGQGIPLLPPVIIPSASSDPGTPTGNVFNEVAGLQPTAFTVHQDSRSGASNFIFVTEDGLLAGWSKQVNTARAITTVNRSAATDGQGDVGAVYKGLAFGKVSSQPYVYATNFRFGTIEMFDRNFTLVKSFTDPQLASNCQSPGQQCYAPFGIQNINGDLYVTFAQQDSDKKDDQSGPGKGFIDIFGTDGTFKKRLASHLVLNSPWGLTLAPHNFGTFSDSLLVGNFGDGRINAYDPQTGEFRGTLMTATGHPIQINGLWGLEFGNDGLAGKSNELFFSAGIRDEAHGLFGKITLR